MISRLAKAILVVAAVFIMLTMLTFLHPPTRAYVDPWTGASFRYGGVEKNVDHAVENSLAHIAAITHNFDPKPVLPGGVIMPKLENATAKAALGRATWKLLHTMTLRYPEKPSSEEREALNSYLHLTSRLYPCGECATEFQALLKQYPPQTASRKSAALWLCFLHNQVNERLQKPEFDCAYLDGTYDCGCGDTPIAEAKTVATKDSDPNDLEVIDPKPRDDWTGVGLIKGGR